VKVTTIASSFRSGTGVGNRELSPARVIAGTSLSSGAEGDYDTSMLLGNDPGAVESGTVSGELEYGSYSESILMHVYPGYFYYGDREFYAFGEKVSLLVSGEPSGDSTVLTLSEFPDGGWDYYDDDADHLFGLGTPIIVHKYTSGTVSSLGIPFDTPISSETGINNHLGYRTTQEWQPPASGEVSGEYVDVVVSGELTGEVPWWFSPLSRFAKTYEYWRDDGVTLSPDQYTYNFEQNTLTLLFSGTPGDEYMVEFEGMNEPFPATVNLSPLMTYPRDSVLCLSPESDIQENPYRLVLYTNRRLANNDIIPVHAEVYSRGGNLLSGQVVTFTLSRPTLEIGDTVVTDFTTEPVYNSGALAYDRITDIPSGTVTEQGVIIDLYNSGETVIRSAGLLDTTANWENYIRGDEYSGEVGSYVFTDITGDTGVASVLYCSPGLVQREVSVLLSATCSGITDTIDISVIPSLSGDVYYDEGQYKDVTEVITLSGMIHDAGDYLFPVPIDCAAPSSIRFATMPIYLEEVYTTGGSGTVYVQDNLVHSGETLLTRAPVDVITMSGDPLMVFYSKDIRVSKFNNMFTYAEV